MSTRIAFDSNTVTWFLQANCEGYDPASDSDLALRVQRVATFRLFLYVDGYPTVVPSVNDELGRIPSKLDRSEHLRWVWYHWREVLPSWLDAEVVSARTAALSIHHPGCGGESDCRIVAQCEADHVDLLATFDARLIKRLGPHSSLVIDTPDGCWQRLKIPSGADPLVRLLPGHPLYSAKWWRW